MIHTGGGLLSTGILKTASLLLSRRVARYVRLIATPERLERAWILAKVFAVIGAFLYPVWQVHLHVYSGAVRELPLSLALSFLTVQGATILIELILSCLIKRKDAARRLRSAAAIGLIREQMAAHLTGENRLPALRLLCLWHGGDVQRCAVEILSRLQGAALGRMSELAAALGLRWVWEKMALLGNVEQRKQAAYCLGLLAASKARPALEKMLGDRCASVQAAACRALLRLGERKDVERVFHLALEAPLLVRVMVASELEPFAKFLASGPLLDVIGSADQQRIVRALELAEVWRVAPSLGRLIPLLIDYRGPVRAAAFGVLPFSAAEADAELWVLAGLADPEEKVRAAAMRAAARMRLHACIPALERGLFAEKGDLAQQCSEALAAMGPEGWRSLEQAALCLRHPAASRSLEALERAQLRPVLLGSAHD